MAEAGLALGMSSILGTFWWVIAMLTYIPNTVYLQNDAGIPQEPFVWMWSNLGNTVKGWTAASYLVTWIIYAAVSVVELVGWSLWVNETPGADCFFKEYTSTAGYWLILYGGILTWVFPFLQLVLPNVRAGGPGLGGKL